ncbi:hypothetical protein SEVIR_4G029650v4 [Setaria viridis]
MFKRRRTRKQKFFDLNRGQLVKQLVSQRADIGERMIITLDELEKATNNFTRLRIAAEIASALILSSLISFNPNNS